MILGPSRDCRQENRAGDAIKKRDEAELRVERCGMASNEEQLRRYALQERRPIDQARIKQTENSSAIRTREYQKAGIKLASTQLLLHERLLGIAGGSPNSRVWIGTGRDPNSHYRGAGLFYRIRGLDS